MRWPAANVAAVVAQLLATKNALASAPTNASTIDVVPAEHGDKIGNMTPPNVANVSTTAAPSWLKKEWVVVNPDFSPHASSNNNDAESAARPSSLHVTKSVAAGIASNKAAVLISLTVKQVDFALLHSMPHVFEDFQRHVQNALASEVGNWIPPEWIKLRLTPGSVRVSARLAAFSNDEADTWHAELRASVVPLRERLVSSISSVPGINAACTGHIAVTDVTTARTEELVQPDESVEDMASSTIGIQPPVLEAAPLVLIVAAGCASCLLLLVLLPFPTSRAAAAGGAGDASKQYAMLPGQVGLGALTTSRMDPTRELATRPPKENGMPQDCTDEANPLQETLPLPETQQQLSAGEEAKSARSRGWSSIFEVLPEQEPLAQRQSSTTSKRPRGESDTDGLLLA